MSRATKDQAKKSVDLYSELLQECGIISEITSREVRGQMKYGFDVFDPKCAYFAEFSSLLDLANTLSAMWSSYSRARFDLGLE